MSGVGVAFQSVKQWLGLGQHELDPRHYCARLYYSKIGTNSWEVHFVISVDLEFRISVSI